MALTNLAGPAAVVFVAPPAARSAEVGTPFPAVALTVTDAFGNPVPAAAVTIGLPAAGPTAAPTSVVTAADGTALFTPTAGAAGAFALILSAGTGTAKLTLTNTPGPAATVTVLAGDVQEPAVGTAFPAEAGTAFAAPVELRVIDPFGNPVGGAAVALSGPDVTLPPGVVTAADGTAGFTPTAGTRAGTFALTAVAGAATARVTLTARPGPLSTLVVVSGDDQSGPANGDFSQPPVVRAVDRFDNPLAGVIVSGGPVPDDRPAAIISTEATGAGGRATLSLRPSPAAGGPYQATVGSWAVVGRATLTNRPGPAFRFQLLAGDGQAAVDADFGRVSVRVVDQYGKPAAGTVVRLSAPAGGASAAVPAALTAGADGTINFTPRANRTAGGYAVRLAGATLEADVRLTNPAGPAAAVDQSAAVGAGFARPLTVRVADAFGNPAAGRYAVGVATDGGDRRGRPASSP